jgi:predicted house-cleaning noncanonical NTP pyrophosphatase (MazG superfamily)
MRRFRFTKLVRDKIVPGIIQSSCKPVYKKLSDSQFLIFTFPFFILIFAF